MRNVLSYGGIVVFPPKGEGKGMAASVGGVALYELYDLIEVTE